MNISVHKKARTTPEIRREIQAADPSISNNALARRYGVHRHTIAKWRKRDTTEDASHRPVRIHATLSPVQEAIVVALRETTLLPLDDLLAVVHEFINPAVSRSGLGRCLRRYGVSDLRALIAEKEGAPEEDKPKRKTFKDYVPGFVHVDLKYLPRMPDETERKYLYVAIDRATRWVYVEILDDKEAATAAGFLERMIAKAAFRVTKVLTDKGKEFTDRFCATGQRKPTGKHSFDRVCRRHGIEHRLTKPRTPQTNGMVERFNGRIAEVIRVTFFNNSQELRDTLLHYVKIYNQQIPQKALGHIAPIQALKNWYQKAPDLFKKRVYNLTGLDTKIMLVDCERLVKRFPMFDLHYV